MLSPPLTASLPRADAWLASRQPVNSNPWLTALLSV
jgi:hypothetical protein